MEFEVSLWVPRVFKHFGFRDKLSFLMTQFWMDVQAKQQYRADHMVVVSRNWIINICFVVLTTLL